MTMITAMQNEMKSSSRSIRGTHAVLAVVMAVVTTQVCKAQQVPPPSAPSSSQTQEQTQESGTSTDLYVMLGSDLDRPGWNPAANYNIGIGHTFGFLKKDPIGDELTAAYTYESGGPAFWHAAINSDTESFGVMKNFDLPKTKRVSGYTWVQIGLTTYVGAGQVQNHFYDGESIGAIVHFDRHSSIWIQETFNKIVSVPWYLTSSIGYTWSW
jgi:hypothetical protein